MKQPSTATWTSPARIRSRLSGPRPPIKSRPMWPAFIRELWIQDTRDILNKPAAVCGGRGGLSSPNLLLMILPALRPHGLAQSIPSRRAGSSATRGSRGGRSPASSPPAAVRGAPALARRTVQVDPGDRRLVAIEALAEESADDAREHVPPCRPMPARGWRTDSASCGPSGAAMTVCAPLRTTMCPHRSAAAPGPSTAGRAGRPRPLHRGAGPSRRGAASGRPVLRASPPSRRPRPGCSARPRRSPRACAGRAGRGAARAGRPRSPRRCPSPARRRRRRPARIECGARGPPPHRRRCPRRRIPKAAGGPIRATPRPRSGPRSPVPPG